MHLNPVTVEGYILDGIATSAGAAPGKYGKYFSKWDMEYGEVGEYFMGLCGLDNGCKAHFPSANLSVAIRELLTMFDSDRNSTCAALVAGGVTTVPPSYMLRATLGKLLADSDTRTLIPPLVYRLNRCNADDVLVLTQFMTYLDSYFSYVFIQDPSLSSLEYYLIIFSEMWKIPAPSQAQIEPRLTSVSIATGDSYDRTALYCAFSKEKSATCDAFNLGNYAAEGILYKRDR
ncbi:uncharacterized protein IUM83_08801 [Phytophthora cinnamomi]|uniref:uncharacterized protein n=1 Tax=Phytophthora cinnamomi TaxID=4785 RepID=UPI00355A257E|nr:hypothetical protein IUM83_08801 [Phytophthora cinnamomi]